MKNPNLTWKESTFVAIDLETTGPYPVSAEICEVAGCRWKNGKIIEKFQSLVKPTQIMEQAVIDIHGITNAMVSDAPSIKKVIKNFSDFIADDYIIAHHAPFDMGFLTFEFEKNGISLPNSLGICSSLVSRKLVTDSVNHKLQTLVKYFDIKSNKAHRALDDSVSCLKVAIECFERMGKEAKISDILTLQQKQLHWSNYSISSIENNTKFTGIVDAIKNAKQITLNYNGGSNPGKERYLHPIGIVRNPDNDFLVALDPSSGMKKKRYYLSNINYLKTS